VVIRTFLDVATGRRIPIRSLLSSLHQRRLLPRRCRSSRCGVSRSTERRLEREGTRRCVVDVAPPSTTLRCRRRRHPSDPDGSRPPPPTHRLTPPRAAGLSSKASSHPGVFSTMETDRSPALLMSHSMCFAETLRRTQTQLTRSGL